MTLHDWLTILAPEISILLLAILTANFVSVIAPFFRGGTGNAFSIASAALPNVTRIGGKVSGYTDNLDNTLTTQASAAGAGTLNKISIGSVATGVAAAGTNQATAAVLTAATTVVSSGAAGSGVAPLSTAIGQSFDIINQSGVAVLVYPPGAGGTVNAAASLSLANGAETVVKCVSPTLCFAH